MIIIVEGIDRVGKTTLCKRLKEEIGIAVLKDFTMNGKLKKKIVNEKMLTTLNVLDAFLDQDIVIDRFHLSEAVYGKLDRGYKNKFVRDIDERLSQMKACLILVRPENEEWLRKAEEEHGSDLEKHAKMFEKWYEKSAIRIKLSTTFSEMDRVVELIKIMR